MTIRGENRVIELTEQELKDIVRSTVDETLTSLGIEHGNPLEMQKDFQHLRAWRESVDSVKSRSVLAVMGILLTGLVGALWVGIKEVLK